MKRLIVKGITVALLVAALAFLAATPVFAATSLHRTGQPGSSAGVTCGSPGATDTPGGAVAAMGSVFNPSGESGEVYAGNAGTPSLANGSSNAVSQYDIACFQVTQH